MADADPTPDLRALFPLGARVVMTAEGVRQFPRAAWAGVVAGYSRYATLRVLPLGCKYAAAYHHGFWRLVDPPAAEG